MFRSGDCRFGIKTWPGRVTENLPAGKTERTIVAEALGISIKVVIT